MLEVKKNWNDGPTGPSKKFDDIFGSLDTIHVVTGRQTDRVLIQAVISRI